MEPTRKFWTLPSRRFHRKGKVHKESDMMSDSAAVTSEGAEIQDVVEEILQYDKRPRSNHVKKAAVSHTSRSKELRLSNEMLEDLENNAQNGRIQMF